MKVVEYMVRAEKIKEHLISLEGKPRKKIMAHAPNGGGSKGGKYVFVDCFFFR
jgi:hypothetical protein